MYKRPVLDVSCLMHFEASGDSEIDCVDDATVGTYEEDEDDAESCSYESSDWNCIKKIENDSDQMVDIFCLKDDEEVENDGNNGEVEDVVEQYYCGGYKAAEVVAPPPPPKKFKKPKVCDDPDTKMMNQRDKVRLFWDREEVVEQYYCGGYKAVLEVVAPPPQPNASEESVVAEKFKKPKVSDDPDMKMMDQRDKDRLFWETCLAS